MQLTDSRKKRRLSEVPLAVPALDTCTDQGFVNFVPQDPLYIPGNVSHTEDNQSHTNNDQSHNQSLTNNSDGTERHNVQPVVFNGSGTETHAAPPTATTAAPATSTAAPAAPTTCSPEPPTDQSSVPHESVPTDTADLPVAPVLPEMNEHEARWCVKIMKACRVDATRKSCSCKQGPCKVIGGIKAFRSILLSKIGNILITVPRMSTPGSMANFQCLSCGSSHLCTVSYSGLWNHVRTQDHFWKKRNQDTPGTYVNKDASTSDFEEWLESCGLEKKHEGLAVVKARKKDKQTRENLSACLSSASAPLNGRPGAIDTDDASGEHGQTRQPSTAPGPSVVPMRAVAMELAQAMLSNVSGLSGMTTPNHRA